MPNWWSQTARRRLATLLARRPKDAFLLASIFVFAAAVPLLLRLELPRLLALLDRGPWIAKADPGRAKRIVYYVDAVLHYGHPFIKRGCLTRGLTLFYFLRRAGLDVALAFGIGKPEGEIEGHCWLVREGEPLYEKRDPRPVFAEYYSFPPRTAS